jgi:hypothetical protein
VRAHPADGAAEGGARRGRRAVAAVVTLLAVLFPALTAGAGLDQPVRRGELQLVEIAAEDPEGARGGPASLFYRGPLDESAFGSPAARQRAVVRARLASLAGILACSGLLYLAVMLSRGRGLAALSCIAFGLLPPVWHEGALVRPELPCAMFGLLALLVLVGLPERLRATRREPPWLGLLSLVALAGAVGTATALAVATMPLYGVFLLVPAACMMIVAVQQTARFVAVLRRSQLRILPFHAVFMRTWPWLLPAFAGLAVAAFLLAVAAGPSTATLARHGLSPDSRWLALPLLLVAGVGGFVRLLQVGLAIGRRSRLRADAVLALYVVGVLLHRLRLERLDDALVAATGFAVALAEGVGLLLFVAGAQLGGLLRRRRAA